MKRLPNINITEKEYEYIISQEETIGGEGMICSSGNKNTLYKLFIDANGNICPMPENKVRKISALYLKQLPNLVKPISTISCNGEVVGYEMTYNPDDRALCCLPHLERKKLIDALKQSKEVLEHFASQDVIYGDISDSNILLNTKTGVITFCDIDNMQVGEYPIDVKGYALMKYYEKTGVIDEKADAFVHNLLTINKLSFTSSCYSEILTALRRGIYPTKYKRPAKDIFASMTTPETFTGEYAIQYIKR